MVHGIGLSIDVANANLSGMSSNDPSAAKPLFELDDAGALLSTDLPLPKRSGKVRDVYDIGDHLMIVSTDRISAFDYVLPVGIPGKGEMLTRLSRFWFERLNVDHHLIGIHVPDSAWDRMRLSVADRSAVGDVLDGRVMIAKKADVVPFECVVRGYLEGSGWREYQSDGIVGGHRLPTGLKQCDRLAEPIFTPATKAESGHDENVTFDEMVESLGQTRGHDAAAALASELRDRSLGLFRDATKIASEAGIIIADTKFEFGHHNGSLILIDEVLTPDSSRFWDANDYAPGSEQASMDKQYVRSWLWNSSWDRNSPPPPLPADVVQRTAEKYRSALERLTAAH